MAYRDMGDWNKAKEEFEKAKGILSKIGYKRELAKLFHEYGLLHKAEGKPGNAREHLEKALSMFEEMGMKLWVEKCEKALGELGEN